MNKLTLVIPGVPVAQPRQRHRIVTSGGRTFASNYTPARDPVNVFKAAIQIAFQNAGGVCCEGPVTVSVIATFPRPKSLTRKRGANTRVPKTSRPDGDNVLKSVNDALNRMAYKDDSQVWRMSIERWIGEPHEQPNTVIEITQE